MSSVQPIVSSSTRELEGPTEHSALLPNVDIDDDSFSQVSYSTDLSPNATATSDFVKDKSTVVVLLCVACILLVDCGMYLQLAPLTRIQESIVCDSYYAENPDLSMTRRNVPEETCKIPAVQSQVALLKGWYALADCVPGFLLSVPYGVIADKYGRKIVLVLSIVGITLAMSWVMLICYSPHVFPIRLIWLGPAFNIVGGGAMVATSTIFTIIADVLPEDQRSIVFFRLSGAVLTAQLIAIPMSSILMERDFWIPMFLGEGAIVTACLVCSLMPETLRARVNSDSTNPSSNNGQEYEEVERELGQSQEESQILLKAALFQRTTEATNRFLSQIKAVFTSPGVIILVFTFLINSIGRSSIDLLLQYTSQKYHWTIA